MPRRKQPAIPDELLDQLLDGSDPRSALADGGLLDGLKKALAERALNAELDHHLETGEPDGRANSRNGYGGKAVLTGTGKLGLQVPRDRLSTFDPQLIAECQRRFPGSDDKIVSMCARGMSTREIQGHLRELYGMEVSPDLVSAATDAVLDEVAEWQNRPLEALHPLVFLDALRVKVRDEGTVRNKAVHVALGVRPDGIKEAARSLGRADRGCQVLAAGHERTQGPWRAGHPDRGGRRPEGLPEAIAAVFPKTQVQACVVHLIRRSLDFVSYKDRKAVAAALKEVYRARGAKAGQEALEAFDEGPWGRKYPVIAQTWRRHWTEVVPFYSFPAEVRRIIYTTNAIKALNAKLRRAVRARGHFPHDDAALKLLYLVLNLASKGWKMPPREWAAAKAQFAILFEDRFVTT